MKDRPSSGSSIAERVRGTTGRAAAAAPTVELGPSYDRENENRGPALSIQFRLLNGNCLTAEYAARWETLFNPSQGITMHFSTGLRVLIKGRNLSRLYQDLSQHKVTAINELDRVQSQVEFADQNVPLVERIELDRGRIDADTGLWMAGGGFFDRDDGRWVRTAATGSVN